MTIRNVNSFKLIDHILLYKVHSHYKAKKEFIAYDSVIDEIIQAQAFELNFNFTEDPNYLLFDPNNSPF